MLWSDDALAKLLQARQAISFPWWNQTSNFLAASCQQNILTMLNLPEQPAKL